MMLQNPDRVLCTVRTGSKAGLFRHGQPTAHLVRFSEKICGIFAANSADWAGFANLSGE
jgi:hypothetical protein